MDERGVNNPPGRRDEERKKRGRESEMEGGQGAMKEGVRVVGDGGWMGRVEGKDRGKKKTKQDEPDTSDITSRVTATIHSSHHYGDENKPNYPCATEGEPQRFGAAL